MSHYEDDFEGSKHDPFVYCEDCDKEVLEENFLEDFSICIDCHSKYDKKNK